MAQVELEIPRPRKAAVDGVELAVDRVLREEGPRPVRALEDHVVPGGAVQEVPELQPGRPRADDAVPVVLCRGRKGEQPRPGRPRAGGTAFGPCNHAPVDPWSKAWSQSLACRTNMLIHNAATSHAQRIHAVFNSPTWSLEELTFQYARAPVTLLRGKSESGFTQ